MLARPDPLITPAQARAQPRPVRALATLSPYLLRRRAHLAAALASLVVAAAATLALPLAVRWVLDIGFSAGGATAMNRSFGVLGLLAALLAASSAARYFLVTTLGERIVTEIRRDLFEHLTRLSPAFFDRARTGDLVSRLSADTTQVRSAVGASASVALRNVVLFAGAATMMAVTSLRLSSLVLLAIPAVVLPLVAFGRGVRSRSREAQERLGEATAFAAEAVGDMRTVQAFTLEHAATQRFGRLVEEAYAAARSATASRSALTATAIFLIFGSVVAVLWWGAHGVLAGAMTAGTLGQFVLYAVLAASALGELSQVWGEVNNAAGATERIGELLATRPLVTAPARPRAWAEPASGAARGSIRIENLHFDYGVTDAPVTQGVLNGITLEVAAGERVAIVGPSGAGKSTLFALLMRFYDPVGGSILIDDVPLTEADPVSLRRRIALVPQDAGIFALSAADNIRCGAWETASADDIRRAAAAAHADGFLSALPHGYDTVIGERGVTLSGGQRQRVAIARALLKDAPILLLDEATSALDAESESHVQAALQTLMVGRTTLVIAHRLATVRSVDRIVVMDGGRIVEEGSHASLSDAGGLYARLAELQFG